MAPIDPLNLQAYIVHPDGAVGRLKERGEGVKHFGLVATAASTRSLESDRLRAAMEAAKDQDPFTSPLDFTLRLYFEVSFFDLARRSKGDAIAVGVSYGKSVRAIFEYFGDIGDRTFILVDPWSKADRSGDKGHTFCHDAAEVANKLARWQNKICLIEGFAPDALADTGDGPLSYININIGEPVAEIETFRRLYPRLSLGGVAVMPGFAWQGAGAAERELIALAEQLGQSFIWLPTGQGVMIKR